MTAKEEQIRKRKSYQDFESFLNFLDARPTKLAIMKQLYILMNAKGAFGTQTNADYAKESLEMLLRDRGLADA